MVMSTAWRASRQAPEGAQQAQKHFFSPLGDHITLLNIFQAYQRVTSLQHLSFCCFRPYSEQVLVGNPFRSFCFLTEADIHLHVLPWHAGEEG
jgi:hypothetical protein